MRILQVLSLSPSVSPINFVGYAGYAWIHLICDPSDSGKDPSKFLTPIEEAMPGHEMSHASSTVHQSK